MGHINIVEPRTRTATFTICALSIACWVCNSWSSAQTSHPKPQTGSVAKTAPAKAAQPATSATALKTKFHPFEVMDEKQGLVVSRVAAPQDWKTTSQVTWRYNDFYQPVYVSARLEAPDGSSWTEFYPAEFFVWLDRAHDRAPLGPGGIGGIHHPNITLPEAMVRYVIAPNRRNAKNLHILGYRPVNNLPKAFSHLNGASWPPGEGICMRVQYELDGSSVDEEFYAFMPQLVTIPSQNAQMPGAEYHRQMFLVHSLGAKSGKLESARPLLGFIATSVEPNPAWQKRYGEVQKMQTDYYNRAMAQGYANIRAAGERSRQISAQNDAFLQHIDAGLAASRAQSAAASSSYNASSNEEFYKNADAFDQGIRGTEHMQDQFGQVSDQ